MAKTRQRKGPAAERPRDPTEAEAAAIAAARARNTARGPRLKLHSDLMPDGRNTIDLTAPHSDKDGWAEQVRDAFGTSSMDFATSELAHLVAVAGSNRKEGAHPKVANAMLAAVQGTEPGDEVEAMLAVQMVATHNLAMNLLLKAKAAEFAEATAAHAGMAVKLMRTFTAQTEALAKLRRGGEQKVTVEHVHVYAGGQAVVGHVTGPGGGQIGNERQPYAITDGATLALPAGAPMLCQDPGGARMPVPSGQGEASVPDARRGKRQRRPKG